MLKLDLSKQINEWSRWDSLRKLGSSPLVRSSLAFAAAGYLLLWNSKFQDFLTIKFDAHVSLWRIWMVYYGGISLAAATALYSCFCPRTIKDHGSAFDLAQSECRHLAIMGLGERYLADVKRLESDCTEGERALWPPDRPQDGFIAQMRNRPEEPEALASLIVYAWRIYNIKHPRVRPLILVIYGLGFVLLAVPAAVTFLQVTLFGLRQLL
jgi:hypothetical protein